jgi:hypothetical protein
MHSFAHQGKRAAILVGLGLIALAVAVPTVHAAKPTRTPLPLGTTELEAGTACPFDVTITTLPGSTLTETVFSDGRVVITSQARERVTNVEEDKSIVLNASGTLTIEEDADGNLHFTSTGHINFFFLPGDEGPFGTTGENGGLFHVVGRATETLDLEQDRITSFSWSGQATELCSLIS